MIVRKPVYTHSLPISSQTGFITRKSGFLTITWALYQTATPPLWASNGLLPSTLMYHEFTWRSCVGWYLPAGVTVPHWLSTGSTKPCLNGFKSAMPSYFSLGICSSCPLDWEIRAFWRWRALLLFAAPFALASLGRWLVAVAANGRCRQ